MAKITKAEVTKNKIAKEVTDKLDILDEDIDIPDDLLEEKAETPDPSESIPEKDIKQVSNEDGSVSVECQSVGMYVRDLSSGAGGFDQWAEDKDYPGSEKFYHRALSLRPRVMNKRKSQGYQRVPNSSEKDGMVLGRIPMKLRNEREAMKQARTKKRTEAINEKFREDAARNGVETFDER